MYWIQCNLNNFIALENILATLKRVRVTGLYYFGCSKMFFFPLKTGPKDEYCEYLWGKIAYI